MMKLAEPNKEQFDYIYGEFNTSRERIREDVQILIEWLEKQPHLPKITDETFLGHVLLRVKNSMEEAKHVLDRYLSLKAVLPEIYDQRDPFDEELLECMKIVTFIPMPELTPEGSRVSILRVLEPQKYETTNPDTVIKSMIMSGDLRLQIDNCHSDIFIFDMKNFTLPVITVMMANLRKFMIPGLKGIPMRQKQYYVINTPSAAESLIMLTKTLLRKELTRKLTLLKSTEDLYSVLPKNCLPKDYGGDLPSFSELNDSWIATLQHHKDWFKEHDNIKADNSKRLHHEDSRLGDLPLEGSFRRIAID